MYSIIVHGGAAFAQLPEARGERQAGLDRAAVTGCAQMQQGGTALDAAEAAVKVLEDAPLFNAGTGSVLTLRGGVEMDAGIAVSTGALGAVAVVERIRNPIALARRVMERTDHTCIAGAGATQLARAFDMPDYDPITPARREKWQTLMAALEANGFDLRDSKELRYWRHLAAIMQPILGPEFHRRGTVGAVARDAKGLIAAATSTGGIWLKLPGRVGDTPIYGAGFYASTHGGCSATGHGEGITRLLLCKAAADHMAKLPAHGAVTEAIAAARNAGVECGLIGIDAAGRIGAAFNTAEMLTATVNVT